MFPAFLREMGAKEYRLPLKCTVRNTAIHTSGELAAGSWWRGCQGMGGVGDEHVPSPRGGRRSPHACRCQCANTGLLLPESSFFFFFQERLEIRIFMGNLLISEYWSLMYFLKLTKQLAGPRLRGP